MVHLAEKTAENTERTIKDGQSRDAGNIGRKTQSEAKRNIKIDITQETKKMNNTGESKTTTKDEHTCLRRSSRVLLFYMTFTVFIIWLNPIWASRKERKTTQHGKDP